MASIYTILTAVTALTSLFQVYSILLFTANTQIITYYYSTLNVDSLPMDLWSPVAQASYRLSYWTSTLSNDDLSKPVTATFK